MGLLLAAERAPWLLVGMLAGTWVNRLHRRPILIAADLGRAMLLLSVPVAWLLDSLLIHQLYLVGFLVGVLTVFFDVAYQSYLPSLVGREQLVEGNGKLAVSNSVARIAGPGLAGGLVQLLTAPIAILVDALSFLVSVLFLKSIRTSEEEPGYREPGGSLWGEMVEGLRIVVGNPLLPADAGASGVFNLFGNLLGVLVALLAAGQLLVGLGGPAYDINLVSLRQTITPDHLLGPVNATMRFIAYGVMPVGALVGGGRVGWFLAFLWLFFSPVRSLRTQPPSAQEPVARATYSN